LPPLSPERAPHTRPSACSRTGPPGDLPGTGVFELENGKIKRWRDYFDLGTYVKSLS